MSEAPDSASTDRQAERRYSTESVIASERLCEQVAISAGARVLDIGCGNGNTALAAARRRGNVTAIDLDEKAMAHAQERADVEGLSGIEFLKADAAKMPFDDASFDFALSTQALVFLPDQEAAAKELARIVRPGGVIGLTAFTRFSIPSLIYDLVNGMFKPPKAPPRPHYSWSDGARAGELLNPYFDAVRVTYHGFDTCFPSPTASFDYTTRWNPNIHRALQNATEEQKKTLRESYLEILHKHNRAADGTFFASMDYAVITGVRKA